MTCTRALAAAGATLLVLGASPARAQGSPADAAFDRGLAEMKAGRYATACPSIEESYRLDPLPGTLFTLAECEAKRGRISSAVNRYRDYLDLYAQLSGADKARQGTRAKIAAAQRAKLEPQVPRLTLLVPPDAPSGLVVTCDGATVSEAALGTSFAVDPGEHTVTTQVRGGPVVERRVEVAVGAQKQVLLAIQRPSAAPPPPAASPAAPAAPEEHPKSTSGARVGAYVLGGIGLAGVVAGSTLGVLAILQKQRVNQECPEFQCSPEGFAALQNVRNYGNGSTIGFAAGGGLLLVGTILFFVSSPSSSSPSSAAPSLKHAAQGLLVSVGSTGGFVGLRGGF